MGGVWNAAPGDGRSESGLQLHLVSSVNRAERLARLLRVLAAIIAEPGLNPLELAEKAGVSDRTLRRDLAHLRDLGYEVAYTAATRSRKSSTSKDVGGSGPAGVAMMACSRRWPR